MQSFCNTSLGEKLKLEEFDKDNDMDALLDTIRLVAQAQGVSRLNRARAVDDPVLAGLPKVDPQEVGNPSQLAGI